VAICKKKKKKEKRDKIYFFWPLFFSAGSSSFITARGAFSPSGAYIAVRRGERKERGRKMAKS
jgi:hypothetical protein